jgi:phosphatidate cytidylyltransferase
MLKRIITAIILVLIFVPVCIFSDTLIFPIVISLLSLIAVYEMSKCLGYNKNLFLTIPLYLIALALPIFRCYVSTNAFFLSHIPAIFVGAIIYALIYVMLRKNNDNLSEIITLYALSIFVISGFTSILLVRLMHNGKAIYLLAFLGAWICDTFAYFTGMFFGKHKLIPEISPKKTIEGAIGGVIFSIIGFALYCLIWNSISDYKLSYLTLCIYGFALAIASQFGDLIASSIKRQYKIKDYGSIFPGHGGVLDRFDGVLLVAPCLYVLNHFIG